MVYRNDILYLLYKLLHKISIDGRVYYITGERCKHQVLKSFFRKLSHQKRTFCKRIKYEIQVLEKEIIWLGGEVGASQEKLKEINRKVLPVINFDREGLIKECYRREKKNIEMCNKLLRRISSGNIREMLLNQKHSVQLTLNEIESMVMRSSEVKGNETGKINLK